MTMSPTAVATARRNLRQRIERFLDNTPQPTAWQADLVLIAIEELEAGGFSDGEWMMLEAERPDLYCKQAGGKADAGPLREALDEAVRDE